jgi:hypothetical protein
MYSFVVQNTYNGINNVPGGTGKATFDVKRAYQSAKHYHKYSRGSDIEICSTVCMSLHGFSGRAHPPGLPRAYPFVVLEILMVSMESRTYQRWVLPNFWIFLSSSIHLYILPTISSAFSHLLLRSHSNPLDLTVTP